MRKPWLVVFMIALAATAARAELRRVEIATLGMD
jgi:hypothetical protein